MCCNCGTRIIQVGGAAPFTFSVTAGNSPYNGGLGVITGPIVINNNDIVHFYSTNTIDFDVTPGSVNVHAEVRIDPNPLNTLSVSAAGLMGSAAPFTFDIGHNVGANYTINNGDLWKISSSNNTIDTVNMGGLISGFNVRIDPAPGNAITTSVNGIFVPSGGVNIYNSDGTITDPTRTVTVGTSTLDFNSTLPLVADSRIHTEAQANQIFTFDIAAGLQNTITTDLGGVTLESNSQSDPVARHIVNATNISSNIRDYTSSGAWQIQMQQYVEFGAGLSYFDFQKFVGTPFFEIRLEGNPGNIGEVLTSQGPGLSPIWNPITVTANSLDNLFFTQDIDWDFGGNDWNVTNADQINFTANSFVVNSPVVCFTGITQNDALTRFLVQDVGGCLSWRDASTVGGDRDWLTIQTNNQENQEINNAYRIGGIGIIGSPHGTTFPFDTNDLIFDIEVAGGTRNTIGVNGIYGGQASFQIIDNDGGPTNSWSAISIGDTVAAPIGVPVLFNIGGPGNRNLAISHVSDGVLGQGDVPLMQFYGQGTTNLGASIVVTDIQSGNSTSVPYQDNFSNGGSNIFPTPLLYVASENKTPVLKLRNTKNTSPNDHAAGIVFETKNGNAGGGKSWIGLGADMNGAGVIADPLSADVLYLGTSTFGGPIADTHISINPQGGVAIYNGGAGSLATVEDLYVSGLLGQIRFAQYDELRDDTGAWTPINFLYTNFDGTIKSAPLTALPGGPIPISDLLSATGTNAIDNLNFNQTWEWNTLTNQNGLQLESSSITTGSLLQLDTNVSGARTGRLINVLSTNSTTGFRGIQVTTNDTSTEAVNITQVGQGRALRIETANQGPIGTGPALVEIERTNALSAGENLLSIQSAGQDTGILVSTNAQNQIVASFNGDNLTSGNVVRAQSTAAFGGAVMQAVGSGVHTGQVLDVQSTTSTANFTNGGARFFFGGNHLGTGLLVQDFSTAGRAMLIDSGVTTGIGLKIEATSVSSGAAVDIETAASDGSIFINFSEGGVSQGSITNGAGNTVLYNTTSDRNLKENIRESNLNATQVINDVDIVEYNFKSDVNKNNLHGLIAQDLYEVYPEAVTKGNDDTLWSIDYSKLVPVLLKSIQELSKRVEELENK